ncbi:MAG: tRNA (guanosine(37)-N1)-methyltransferase TrmD [Candidatus Zixiibacteriota bacterium]
MKICILTLFPELFKPFTETGLIAKAIDENSIDIVLINPRDFANNKHNSVDDDPYGGGGGMVIQAKPIVDAFESIEPEIRNNAKILVTSARGEKLNQNKLIEFSEIDNLIIICGRYKDIDQRALDIIGAEEISIGDYVLQGGEVPAMAIIEGVTRLLPNFLGDFDSASSDSFWEDRKLSAPSYTRPRVFRGIEVPEVLVSGNHAKIHKWREEVGKKITEFKRPDLTDKKDSD